MKKMLCSTSPTAQSNAIIMRVKSAVPPVVNIRTDPNPVCSGLPVSFFAEITNGGASPQYQWQINGMDANEAGSNGDAYTTTDLKNGDAASCRVSADGMCAVGVSNTMIMQINPTPLIEPNLIYTSTTNERLYFCDDIVCKSLLEDCLFGRRTGLKNIFLTTI